MDRRISQLISEEFQYFSVYHDDDYWAKYVTHDRPYCRNGVAIALRKSAFDHATFVDFELGTGNHAAVAVCRHIATDKWFRIVSVHFELDDMSVRDQEVRAVASYLRPGTQHGIYIDVIAGDFNSDLDDVMRAEFIDRGFIDAHIEVNNAMATHPEMIGDDVIDHILVRGKATETVEARTHSGDIMTSHPLNSDEHRAERLCRCLEFNGSDHFAIEATIRVERKTVVRNERL